MSIFLLLIRSATHQIAARLPPLMDGNLFCSYVESLVSTTSQQPAATTLCSQQKELCYEGNYGSGSMSPYKYHKKDNNAGMRYSIEMQTTYIKKKYQELGACQRKQTLQKHIFRFFHEHFIHP